MISRNRAREWRGWRGGKVDREASIVELPPPVEATDGLIDDLGNQIVDDNGDRIVLG